MISRRNILRGGVAGAGALLLARSNFVTSIAVAAAPVAPRFVFIIMRGAADGMGIVAPVGDPAFAGMRGRLADETEGGLALNSTFRLHPSLAKGAELYRAKQAVFVHATGSPYQNRSHFDGQNVLETGGASPYQRKDGWLHRLTGLLPDGRDGTITMSNAIPAALRGSSNVLTVGPDELPAVPEDLLDSVGRLYKADAVLAPVWNQAMASRQLLDGIDEGHAAQQLGRTAGELLGEGQEGRIAFIETGGWDTHTQQAGRLARQLKKLDSTIAGLQAGLGPAWAQTMVLVATEFGRTAHVNGTDGTDHGTGGVAMLLGGAVRGGRVVADWPGLAPSALYEGRDLRTTTDLFSLVSTVLSGHFSLDPGRTAQTLFPDTGARALNLSVA